MVIRAMVIEGAEKDIDIKRTSVGAAVTVKRYTRGRGRVDEVVCEVGRDESPEARFAKARLAAAFVYGSDRDGNPRGTNSMVHDVLDAIERVAGC